MSWLLVSVVCTALVAGCVSLSPNLQQEVVRAAGVKQAINQHLFYFKDYLSNYKLDASIKGFRNQLLWSRNGKNGSSLTAQCINQTLDVMTALSEGQPWAIQVIDAAGKPETGLLRGNIQWRGSYKECTKIANKGTHKMNGKYCTATFANSSMNAKEPSHSVNMFSASVNLQLGICVPQTCAEDLLELMINEALSVIPGDVMSQFKVLIDCQPESIPLDSAAIAMIVILSVLGALLVTSTVYDVWVYQPSLVYRTEDRNAYIKDSLPDTEEQLGEDTPLLKKDITKPTQHGIGRRLLLSFSLYTNGAKILDTNVNNGTIQVLHGIRFLSLTWVILGHSFGFVAGFVSNLTEFMSDAKSWSFQLILNSVVAVDTFLLLSGLLVSYLMLKNLSQKEKPWKNNWLLYYFHRFWRLTPAYMLVIGTYVALFKYWGTGPVWPQEGFDKENCSKYWWRNLLYIQNLFPAIDMCMSWSWYLAIDMQYYLLSPLLVLPYLRSKWLGLGVTGLFLLAQIIASVVVVVQNHLLCGFAGFVGSFTNGDYATLNGILDFMDKLYFKPWIRFGPYGVGVITGYFMFASDRKITMPRPVALLGWCVAAAVALAVVYGTYEPAQGNLMTPAGSSVYQALHSTAWALAVAWVIIACDSGHGGFVNTFLCWKLFVPLSRLTYMAYLVHPVVIYWFFYNQQTVLYYTSLNSAFNYIGFLVFSYAIAFMGSLAFESPMIGMERVVFQRETRSISKK